MITLDDLKVGGAAGGGIGHHWVLDLQIGLSLAISAASLIYVVMKIIKLKKGK